MSEHCPLSGGHQSIEGIPRFCREHCESLWDQAVKEQRLDGAYDHYGVDPVGCEREIEHSHEGLQSVDDGPARVYSLVDVCVEHEVEVGEQGYPFECPHNF